MWGMGGWTESDDDESRAALQLAVDLGCTFFDTAWGYGEGHSERLLGELVRANPDKRLYTATKIPPKNFTWPSRREFTLDETYPPDHIREYTEKSLHNFGLDRVDLQQFHVWEDAWAWDERWQRAVDDLKREGLIGAIGISINRWEPWNALETVRSGQIDAVQVIYNIFDQAPEDELFPSVPRAQRGLAHGYADDGESLAGRGLAQQLLRARKPAGECRARRRTQAVGTAADDHGGARLALHPLESRCQHGHSRHAPTAAR